MPPGGRTGAGPACDHPDPVGPARGRAGGVPAQTRRAVAAPDRVRDLDRRAGGGAGWRDSEAGIPAARGRRRDATSDALPVRAAEPGAGLGELLGDWAGRCTAAHQLPTLHYPGAAAAGTTAGRLPESLPALNTLPAPRPAARSGNRLVCTGLRSQDRLDARGPLVERLAWQLAALWLEPAGGLLR